MAPGTGPGLAWVQAVRAAPGNVARTIQVLLSFAPFLLGNRGKAEGRTKQRVMMLRAGVGPELPLVLGCNSRPLSIPVPILERETCPNSLTFVSGC